MEHVLIERLTPVDSHIISEATGDEQGKSKSYYLKGLFIQGDVRNHNGRIYPASQIRSAVDQLNERLRRGESVLGEMDHPDGLNINLDRVSHMITEMHMEGVDGYGTMKIIETVQAGQLIKGLLDAGVKLGVSSRGSGNVGPGGYVSDFEIITIDVVATPSAPGAFPVSIREARKRKEIEYLSSLSENDQLAQKYLQKELLKFIQDL